MAQTVDLWGATYSDVPFIDVPSGNGTARFADPSPTTALEQDVAQGKIFVKADGSLGVGTGSSGGTPAISVVDTPDSHGGTVRTITALDISDSTLETADQLAQGITGYNKLGVKLTGTGGGTPSATQHTIYFEFSDSTNTTITAYYDSTFISDAITATTPKTYGGKTVTLAQLDGVTWYEPADIPLNTQLIDYNDVLTGYTVDDDGSIISSDAWNCVTDFTPINPTMTFSFMCRQYAAIGFYDNNRTAIRIVVADDIKESATNYIASGYLTPSIIPSNAVYVVLCGNSYGIQDTLSLIRTA